MTDDTDTADLPQLPTVVSWAISGMIRHAMVGVGAALLAGHVLPNQLAVNEFVNWGVNGALILGGLGWSYMNEKSKTSTSEVTNG